MKKVYFLGIGGIGMSALARWYKHEGYYVAGYDRTPSPLTKELEAEGMPIHYDDAEQNIPAEFKQNINNVTVIYTPAVPTNSNEYLYFIKSGYSVLKRSQALEIISNSKKTLAVAGTHGKTTTVTILTHLLNTAVQGGCTAFLGGISKNLNSNLSLSTNDWLVAEADEYDRSFLRLFPQAAVITAADPDHLDIYGTPAEFKKTFGMFASQIKSDGILVIEKQTEIPLTDVKCKVYRYSGSEHADFYADNLKLTDGGFYTFDLITPFGNINGCKLGIPGKINIENAVGAAALALYAGADKEKLKEGLASFSGVKRRFDVYINTPNLVYLDDYAHHPEELRHAITSVREMFPGRTICGIFQPHLYTRTRDFAGGFSKSLSLLDDLILLDIYPARELPIEGVDSKLIFDNVTITDKIMCSKQDLLDVIKSKKDIDILITFGAGDIDRFTKPLANLLKNNL